MNGTILADGLAQVGVGLSSVVFFSKVGDELVEVIEELGASFSKVSNFSSAVVGIFRLS